MMSSANQNTPCGEIPQIQMIKPNEAAQYIMRFWQNVQCRAFGNNMGSGTFLPMDEFVSNDDPGEGIKGICIYSCISEHEDNILYMAGKTTFACPARSQDIPIQDEDALSVSNSVIAPFTAPQYANEVSMLDALKQLRYDTNLPIPPQIRGATVRTDNQQFIDKFQNDAGYVQAGFAFTKQFDFDRFLKQETENVIGFFALFGFDGGLSNNKVRLVLIAADENGVPLLQAEAICLEKSWPPNN
jgi:hypothetical protein